MKPFVRHIRFFVVPLFLVMSVNAFGSEQDALNAYHQAEAAFDRQDYQTAEALYKKAINEHSRDGTVEISSAHYIWQETTRGMKRKTVAGEITMHEYYPNAGLAHIHKIKGDSSSNRLAAEAELARFTKGHCARSEKFSNPPILVAEVDLIEEIPDRIIDVGEQVQLLFTIENKGGCLAGGVVLALNKRGGLLFKNRVEIGNILPGKMKIAMVNITGGKKIKTGQESISIKISEIDGFDAESKIDVATRAYQAPRLTITNSSIKSRGKRLIVAEYIVTNAGEGKA